MQVQKKRSYKIVALAAILAAVTLYVGGIVLAQSGSNVSHDMLKAVGRDSLALCVEGAAGATIDGTVAQQRVRKIIQGFSSDAKWYEAGYGRSPSVVDTPCPNRAPLLRENTSNSLRVEKPGKYSFYIFVLPSAEITRLFPANRTYRAEPMEIVRTGSCYEVSTACWRLERPRCH